MTWQRDGLKFQKSLLLINIQLEYIKYSINYGCKDVLKPCNVIFNNGSESKRNFIPLLKYVYVKPTCTAIKNPQENAILERTQQVVNSILKTKDIANFIFDAIAPWSDIIASIAYLLQCSYHRTLQYTPEQLVFCCDMILDIHFQPNYEEMCLSKQKPINNNNKHETAKWVEYNYEVGQYAYILRDRNYHKLEGEKLAMFTIT